MCKKCWKTLDEMRSLFLERERNYPIRQIFRKPRLKRCFYDRSPLKRRLNEN